MALCKFKASWVYIVSSGSARLCGETLSQKKKVSYMEYLGFFPIIILLIQNNVSFMDPRHNRKTEILGA